MGLFSKLLRPSADPAPAIEAGRSMPPPVPRDAGDDDEEFCLGSGAAFTPQAPAEKRGAEKRRHPRVVQTTAGGAYGVPRYWVYGGRDCYEDPSDEASTMSLDEAREKAAMPRPDLEGKVELPRYLKARSGDNP